MARNKASTRGFTLVELPAVSGSKRIAFTLVELLVVIGIIALLISILLPTLGAARRQAQTVKCSAALRSIGQAFQLYAIDNKGYAPPWRAGNVSGNSGGGGGTYNLYGIAYNSGSDSTNPDGSGTAKDACFWFDFLSKYLTKSHGGSGDASGVAQLQAQSSVIWGCPNWEGYADTAGTAAVISGGAGKNRQYVGYAYNYEPDVGPQFTTYSHQGNFYYGQYSNDIRSADNFSSQNFTSSNGETARWFKLTDYRPAPEKAIVGDSFYWKLETQPWNGGGAFKPQQAVFNSSAAAGYGTKSYANGSAPGTTFDLYRHGIYPAQVAGANPYFKSTGGKIAYNILYADGHVMTGNDRSDAYRAEWQEFPVTAPASIAFPNNLSD